MVQDILTTHSRSLHSHVSASVVNVQIAGDDSTAGGKGGRKELL